MSVILRVLTAGYFVGLLIFAGCLILMLTNGTGLTWIEIPGRLIIGAGVLTFGSKAAVMWLYRDKESVGG